MHTLRFTVLFALLVLPCYGFDKFTISRDDEVYKAFADVAQTRDGVLVITYRESMMHAPRPFSRLKVRRSLDGGNRWLPEQTLLERHDDKGEERLNCPRIALLSDGSLVLLIDSMPADRINEASGASIFLFRSTDSGATWVGPVDTGIRGAYVPSIKQLSSGALLVGLTKATYPDGLQGRPLTEQVVYRSEDLGKSWESSGAVPKHPEILLRLVEGDFAQMDDGTVVLYMREEDEGLSGWKSLSKDGGRTWSAPFRGVRHPVRGRPSVGRLRSGEIVTTYRVITGSSRGLAMYIETPAEAVSTQTSGRWMLIDNDRSLYPDTGYSGWVQLSDGRLFVVNYIVDDAPRAQIRGYRIGREDYFLFPEGDLPWMPPNKSNQPYMAIADDKAKMQASKNMALGHIDHVPTQK